MKRITVTVTHPTGRRFQFAAIDAATGIPIAKGLGGDTAQVAFHRARCEVRRVLAEAGGASPYYLGRLEFNERTV